jgi:flavin reductase (DIM6/NTAB) family NADH-FMN oxidoreductase RutF
MFNPFSWFGHHDEGSFVNVPILDNFYQTSSFFPMPVVLMTTIAENGQTNVAPYSLCFPHVISGKHAMMLIARGSSNTAQNILRTGLAAINFIPDDKEYLKCCVELGFPGETTEEKMKHSIFHLLSSQRDNKIDGIIYPEILEEAVQVFECSWDSSHPYMVNELEYHFLLTVDKIVMKEKWKKALADGGSFPSLPVDYGYRDNMHFWFSPFKDPYPVDIPKDKKQDVNTVHYQAERIDPEVKWDIEASEKLVRVPPVFLKKVLTQIVEEAKKRGISLVTADLLDEIRAKQKR